MPPGAGINVQGQSLILPEGKEGGLTLDQRAMVSRPPMRVQARRLISDPRDGRFDRFRLFQSTLWSWVS